MSNEKVLIYEFGEFRLNLAQQTLTRNGEPLTITPRAYDLLLFLVQNRGRVLGKDELMKGVWRESFVEESNLSQNIFVLRKILGEDHNGNRFIQTIPRRGYKFVAPVRELDAALKIEYPDNAFSAVSATDYWTRNSPFRSLRAFEPEDSWLFFGRESETEDLLARFSRSPVLAVVGNSGSGKSSLVRAGLVSALYQGRFKHADFTASSWRIVLFRPSGAPFDYLAEVLPAALAPELGLKEQAEFIAHCREKLPSGGDTLQNAISALANAATGQSRPTHILLVADQFEEIFTLTDNRQIRERYIDALLAATGLNHAIPVYLALILRADFYANCLEHAQLSRVLETSLYNVPRMAVEQLHKSIEKRLALAGGSAEPGLIDSLLADVGAEPGDLALLEHALGLLWEKCGGAGCMLTNKAYSEIGRLRGALGRHADQVYADIVDDTQKHVVRKIFIELIQLGEGAQDTRRRLQKTDLLALGNPQEIEFIFAHLVSSRLISTGAEGHQTFVEISHEALIREWSTLREWIAQNREEIRLERRLIQAAEEWQRVKQDPGALLQGARLSQAEEWLAQHPEATALVRRFLQAGIEARDAALRKEHEATERELGRQSQLRQEADARAAAEKKLREQQESAALQMRRLAMHLRRLSAALTVLLVVAIGTTWFAYRERSIEQSNALLSQASDLLISDHGRAMDLAIQAFGVRKTEDARLAIAKAFPQLVATLKHDGPVERAIFSSDGQRVLTASYDHTARIWDSSDGHLLVALQGHSDKVEHASFSPDGQRVATASYDHTARVWNSVDGRLIAILQGHTAAVIRVAFSPDGQHLLTASYDHTARIWSNDGRLLATLQHNGTVARAEFSPDGLRIVTASWDHTARIWDSASGQLLATLQGHTGELIYSEFSPDGQRVITTSRDQTARVWSSADGRLLATLRHQGLVVMARFSPDGQHIVSASEDSTARVWNSADGSLLATLNHDGAVQHADFSPDGKQIITAGFDRTARLWNAASGRLLAVFQGHSDQVMHAAFSADGQHIVTASADGTARIWSTVSGRTLLALQGHTDRVYRVAFSPDGQRIVTASADGTARIWDAASGKLLMTLQGHAERVWQVAFSPDGTRVITASWDHTARVWDSTDGHLLATLIGHASEVLDAVFSPDGRRIVTASRDKTARVWNSTDGALLFVLQGHSGEIWHAKFSSDGQRIVTASSDGTARVWSAIDGTALATLQGHNAGVINAEFSPDGQRMVTAGSDGTARVWSAIDGRELATLRGHSSQVNDAEFSPDGRLIVSASSDNTARIWNSSDGKLLAILRNHTSGIVRAKFSPDGQRIVTASSDHDARIWNSTDGSLLATLRGHADTVWDATFSPDGQHIATASMDHTARVWVVMTLSDVEKLLAK